MKKEIAITKNGFDLLRIIEGKNDKYACEFIIEPMIDIENIRIFAMPLFSKIEYVELEKNCKLHITYHKSTLTKPTKIHLRMEYKNGEVKYKTLPLNNLLDPNINTEIPIPLLKVIVPDKVLTIKYTKKNRHREINIKDSNIIEIFMTNVKFRVSKYFQKWGTMQRALIENSFQYMATGLTKYIGINLFEQMHTNIREGSIAAIYTDVTDDIGILINTVKSIELNVETMDFLFIDNMAYLAFIGGLEYVNAEYPKGKLAYKIDIENKEFFSDKERRKWEYIFDKEFEKLKQLVKKSNGKYDKQIKNEEKIMKERANIRKKVLEFKKKLKEFYKSDTIEKTLLENAFNVNLLLAKYLEIEEPFAFSTKFLVEKNGEKFEFEEVLLWYNNYYIEILHGELRIFFDEQEDEPEILIIEKMGENKFYKRGYCKRLLLKDNIKILEQGFYKLSKEKMKESFNNNETEIDNLYKMIINQKI